LVLPTGDFKKTLGYGSPGIQVDLPASKRLSNSWVVHANIGTTLTPGAKNPTSDSAYVKKALVQYNFGASVIWLAKGNFNVMLECIEYLYNGVNNSGDVFHGSTTILNPGLRMAINLGNLQIVPGISVPVTIRDQAVNPGLFFYLSFEHPY